MKSANSLPYHVEVIGVKGLNPMTKSIRFKFLNKENAKDFAFKSGQYILVSVLGFNEVPLTITTTPEDLPEFEVAVRSVGDATKALHRLVVGDKVYVSGPLGNDISLEKAYGEELLLVAGGIGLAPLRSTIQTIMNDSNLVKKLTIIYGAKTPEDLIFKNELAKWKKVSDVHITVDKADSDWSGSVGRIPDILKKLNIDKASTAIICGPPIMYEAVVKDLLAKGLSPHNIQIMLERRMRCGIGKCQHCTCGEKYVCLDGPTFTWSGLKENWEAFK